MDRWIKAFFALMLALVIVLGGLLMVKGAHGARTEKPAPYPVEIHEGSAL